MVLHLRRATRAGEGEENLVAANKSSAMKVRLSDAESEALVKACAKLGVTRSRLLRRFVREFVRGRPDYFDDGLAELRACHRQLAAVGRNLNQIARALNEERAAGREAAGDSLLSRAGEVERLSVLLEVTRTRVAETKATFAAELLSANHRNVRIVRIARTKT